MNDPIHTTVSHLLTQAYRLPCSTAAGAFARLVPSTSRFQLALDELFPLLTDSIPSSAASKSPVENDWQQELATRILVSYILYALYAPHPMSINPFREALLSTFLAERTKLSTGEGNAQLVWVLWKILKGDGNDIGPFSPSTLASSPLPPKLRAAQLSLDEEMTSPPTSPSPSPSPSPAVQEEAQALSLLLAARSRVLTLHEIRVLTPHLQSILFSSTLVPTQDLPDIISHNPSSAALTLPITKHLLLSSTDIIKGEMETVLTTLLPPTLNSFDLWGRLLKDEDLASSSQLALQLRQTLLPLFLTHCIATLAEWERRVKQDELEGDKWERGVLLFCRFVLSLIKGGVMTDMDTTEVMYFALSHSRLDDARELYGVLVAGSGNAVGLI